MSTFALVNEYVLFNSVDLSDHTRAATLAAEAAALDSTTMGDTWMENTGGLKSGTLTIEFLDDFAAGSVDATVWTAFDANVAIAVAVRPVNTTISTTNPEYQVNILPNQWNMGGTLGEMAGKSLTFPYTGQLVRDITA